MLNSFLTIIATGIGIIGGVLGIIKTIITIRNSPNNSKFSPYQTQQGNLTAIYRPNTHMGLLWGIVIVLTLIVATLSGGAIVYILRLRNITTNSIIYSTNAPGKGINCDSGNANWGLDQQPNGAIQCSSVGMTITNPSTSTYIEEVHFSWPSHPFSNSYSVQMHINRFSQKTCAAIFTNEQNTGGGGYENDICSDGVWIIKVFPRTGQSTILNHGNIALSSDYSVVVGVKNTTHTFIVNGITVAIITDPTYTTTSSIGLGVYSFASPIAPVAVTYSEFSYVATQP